MTTDQVAVPPSHDVAEPGHEKPTTNLGVTNTKLAMWLFLSSDCLFFGAFISAYLFYRGRPQPGPHPVDVYNIPFTSVTSFILLMSSLTMVLALAAIMRGDYRRLRVWLLATALFGATFIGGQVFEFTVENGRDWTLNAVTSRLAFAPLGLFGGTQGAAGSFVVDGEPVRTQKRIDLHSGAVVRLELPGGGGYGAPTEEATPA
jgi:heme/copper-type cytochrome/quinol oxidase subunit 3